jgi:hypothetical protein
VEEKEKVGDGQDDTGGRRYERRKDKVGVGGGGEDDLWVPCVSEWMVRFGK